MIRDLIPARWRKVVYTVLAAVSSVELALDAVGWGLVPAEMQGKALIVLSALGFTLAAGNTNKGV
jgi:hypothetical protein